MRPARKPPPRIGARSKRLIKAKPVTYDGYRFDSNAEFERYLVLKQRQADGKISDLTVHTTTQLRVAGNPILIRSAGYPNGRVATYTDDFRYREFDPENPSHPRLVVEDVKGYDTPIARFRRAVFEACTGIQVTVVK